MLLDPGHDGGNGADPVEVNHLVDAGGFMKSCDTDGASTDAGYPEHAFTFDVALRTAALLRSQGARVVLTRATDTGVGPCINVRAALGNIAHADAAVSIHADGGPATGYGFHVIVPGTVTYAGGGDAAIVGPSATLGKDLRDAFHLRTGEVTSTYLGVNGIDRRTDLGGLNLSVVSKVFIECANMRNAADAVKVSSPRWRQSAAAGIAAGISNYLLAAGARR